MDKLKNFIDTHRDAFEDETLPEGHFERFSQKLPESRQSKRFKIYTLCACLAAACAALFFLIHVPENNISLPLDNSLQASGKVLHTTDKNDTAQTATPNAEQPLIPPAAKESKTNDCQQKTEIDELRLYYNMQMNDVMARMEILCKEQRTPGAAGLLKETHKVLTDNYMFETTVLPTLPCSDDGLFAMNQHYSNSLESLSFMLRQMEYDINNNN